MEITDRIELLLQSKGSNRVFSVAPDQTVFEAIEKMAEERIGAVLVISGNRLVGILSERDYARKVVLKGHSSKDTLVIMIMTSPVIFVTIKNTVDECMSISPSSRGQERNRSGCGVDWRSCPLDHLRSGTRYPGTGGLHFRTISRLNLPGRGILANFVYIFGPIPE